MLDWNIHDMPVFFVAHCLSKNGRSGKNDALYNLRIEKKEMLAFEKMLVSNGNTRKSAVARAMARQVRKERK